MCVSVPKLTQVLKLLKFCLKKNHLGSFVNRPNCSLDFDNSAHYNVPFMGIIELDALQQ